MRIHDVRWRRYRVPFRAPFVTAHGTLTSREGALVAVEATGGDEDGVPVTGWGEIAPLASQGQGTLDAALAPLPPLVHALRGRLGDALDAMLHLGDLPAPTRFGLGTALLDARCRLAGRRLCDALAAEDFTPRVTVAVNVVIGAAEADVAARLAGTAVAAGFDTVKLKLKVGGAGGRDAEVARVAAVRAAIGPRTRLRLDANAAWDVDTAAITLAGCVPYDVEYVEQPIAADDLRGMRALRRLVRIPIAADEAVIGAESVAALLDAKAADVLILKAQGLGAPEEVAALVAEATARGVRCVLTTTLEAGIGVAAALHLAAALPALGAPAGLATLDLLADDLIAPGLVLERGALRLPDGPGLGVTPDVAALETFGAG